MTHLQGPQSIAKYGVSDLGDGAVKISTLSQFRVSANRRYTFGFFDVIQAYCGWADSQAKNQTDFLVLALGPIFLLSLLLWLLPAWLGKTIALILLAPALYIFYQALRLYAARGR